MSKSVSISLGLLTEKNTKRCEEVFHPIDDWTPAEWALCVAGEAGEVCGAVKNLKRLEEGRVPPNRPGFPKSEAEAIGAIASEVADTIIYLDLLCTSLGIDISNAIIHKFNKVSEENGSDVTVYPDVRLQSF